MMQVSSDFLFNRETFQIAINIVDKTLSTFRVSKNVLQLVGLAALIIGSKIEELYPPKVSDFAQMAGHAYSHIEIHAMERKVLRCLGWKIMPATLSHWAVWLMTQWDAFVKHSVVEFDIRFKLEHEYSYKLYRQVTGLLDAVVMDSVSLSISQSKLVAACIYLVLQREVCTGQFVGVFEKYFEYWLGATLELASTSTLDRAKEYLQGFLGLPIGYDTPKACEDISRDQLAKSYEDFLGYQTYNLETMPFVKAKLRNNR